ncbi:hypothetical protein ID741_003549 [Enterococcus sp. AZ103]
MINYGKEPVSDYFLIEIKSFCASVECVERGLNLLTTNFLGPFSVAFNKLFTFFPT